MDNSELVGEVAELLGGGRSGLVTDVDGTISPIVAHPDRLLEQLRGRTVTFIGDGAAAYRDRILAAGEIDVTLAEPLTPPLAGAIGRLAAAAADAGDHPPPHAIRPLYVRRPDPELARDAKRAG